MNKIVLEHYPASNLPDELRRGIADSASVTVTVEVEDNEQSRREKLLALIQHVQARQYNTSLEEAVARVRQLRDEWD